MADPIASSFNEALCDIFRENSIPIDLVEPAGKNSNKLQVVSTMGISGDLRGNIVFGLDFESARSMVGLLFEASGLFSAQNIAPEEEGFGDLAKSTIGEFANQITGRALMVLSRQAVDCSMSPPTVFTGDSVVPDLGTSAEVEYVSFVRGGFGSAVLHVGIKERKKS
ncbi:MAG: chemotaxis protein CheX [Spirochaetales bacterium]|nr:chemotaxis protein CheX [Spirochaetales bacterium]